MRVSRNKKKKEASNSCSQAGLDFFFFYLPFFFFFFYSSSHLKYLSIELCLYTFTLLLTYFASSSPGVSWIFYPIASPFTHLALLFSLIDIRTAATRTYSLSFSFRVPYLPRSLSQLAPRHAMCCRLIFLKRSHLTAL